MRTDARHDRPVDVWLKTAAANRSSEQLIELLDRALAALWRRAHQTLGVVTLEAIGHRVLSDVSEHFPALSAVTVSERGFDCGRLHEPARVRPPAEVAAWVRLVLVTWLGVVGNLTAEVLTPILQGELAKISLDADTSRAGAAPGREGMNS